MVEIDFPVPEVIIDTHCHARGLKHSYKTTVLQVLKEALAGLINVSMFMPNTLPPITSIEILNIYIEIMLMAKKTLGIKYDQYVYFGVTDKNLKECDEALKNPLVVGVKGYPLHLNGKAVTTGTIGIIHDNTLLEAMTLARKHDKVASFHCDDPIIIALEGNTIRAEISYVKKILRLGKIVPDVKIIICHVSCIESALLIIEAQNQGMKVAMEVMPQYLWFDSEGTNWRPGLDPVFYKCFNSLRPAEHRLFLIGLLKLINPLILLSTDNAGHPTKEKIEKKLGGFPSNQHLVPTAVTLALQEGISPEQIANLLSFNAIDFFNLPIGKSLVPRTFVKKTDEAIYNNGIITNPWLGSEMFFPTNK